MKIKLSEYRHLYEFLLECFMSSGKFTRIRFKHYSDTIYTYNYLFEVTEDDVRYFKAFVTRLEEGEGLPQDLTGLWMSNTIVHDLTKGRTENRIEHIEKVYKWVNQVYRIEPHYLPIKTDQDED